MDSYPMIGNEIVFTSDLDLDITVFDDLKNIPCDRFLRARRMSTVVRFMPLTPMGYISGKVPSAL